MTEQLSKNWWKNLLKILNGNKTIIALTLLMITEKIPIPEPYKAIIIAILTALSGGSLVHHAMKGNFTPHVGNEPAKLSNLKKLINIKTLTCILILIILLAYLQINV